MTEVERRRYRSKKRRRRKWKRRLKIFIRLLILLLPIFIIIGIIMAFVYFRKPHFKLNTSISGVNCSWLTLDKAEEKLNKELNHQDITFVFSDFDKYFYSTEFYDLEPVQVEETLETFYKIQKQNSTRKEFDFNSYSFNKRKLLETLQQLPNLQEENMVKSSNAYIAISDSNYLTIIPHVYGNWIDFTDAYDFACENLQNGNVIIDFTTIVEKPVILSDDANLVVQKEQLNSILSSQISLTLADDSVIGLDNNTLVTWLVRDEDGNYKINIDSNLPNFLNSVVEKVKEISSFLYFNATDVGAVQVPIGEQYRSSINQEQELAQLKSEIISGATVSRSPIYTSKPLSLDEVTSYIELDISNQRVLMYVDGKCILDSPCVTGNVSGGNDTPIGLYYLTYKTTDDYLEGYNNDGSRYKSFVNYWMPFNGGIGFHDASWRYGKFGGDIYLNDGSHGCVNLPLESAKTIYEHIDKNMPIIIYESGTNSN